MNTATSAKEKYSAKSISPRKCLCLCSVLFLQLWLTSNFVQAVTPSNNFSSPEQQQINRIKSAYLFNFLKYIDLPHQQLEDKSETFQVCVLGKDPLGEALDAMSGRTAKGRQVSIQRLASVEHARNCDIVYISDSEAAKLDPTLSSLNKISTLTVSDIKDFSKAGGMIGFVTRDKKISIEVNLANAAQAKIKISALLLEIATIVE